MKALSHILATGIILLGLSAGSYADKYDIKASQTHSGKLVSGDPINIGIQLKGVNLESIYFSSDLKMMAIVSNRTPVKVHPEIGVALFDKSGNLIATGKSGSFKVGSIKPGDQKDYTFDFNDYIDNYSKVAKYQLIYTIKEKLPK